MRHRFLLAVIGPMLVAASMGADCVYECLQNHGCMDGPDINCPYCHEMLGDCNPDGVTQLSRAYNPAGAVLYLAVSGGNQQYTAVDAICYKQQACGEGSAALALRMHRAGTRVLHLSNHSSADLLYLLLQGGRGDEHFDIERDLQGL